MNVLRWRPGRGWLVLAGGASDDVRAQALERAAADGGIAYVHFGSAGDDLLDEMAGLGAPSGYLVDVMSEDDQTLLARLGDAGMVIVAGQVAPLEARSALMGAAADGMSAAYARGAVVLVEGAASMAFGAYIVSDSGETAAGLNWLEEALIVPGAASLAESSPARILLNAYADALAVGLGSRSALALGPDGIVETWGERQIAVALGRGYSAT